MFVFMVLAPIGSLSRPLRAFARRASLRAALSSAYCLQIALAIGLSAGLGWRAIDRAGLHLAHQQQASIAARVRDRLERDMREVRQLERAAQDAFALGLWSERAGLESWLWQQARARESLAIGVRDRQGRVIKIVRQNDTRPIGIERASPTAPAVAYRLGDDGQRLEAIPLSAVERATLGEELFDNLGQQEASLPIVRFPLPDGPGSATAASVLLAAVLPTDDLERLLERIHVGERGMVAVVDGDGQPLASSIASETLSDFASEAGGSGGSAESAGSAESTRPDPTRTTAAIAESSDKLERAIAALRTGGTQLPTRPERTELRLDGVRYQVAIAPVELSASQTLWVVTALADRDFARVGVRDVIVTLAIVVAATLAIGAVDFLKVRMTQRAIANLQAAIDALADRDWLKVELSDRPSEFRPVRASLLRAAQHLKADFQKLRERNTALEKNERFKTWLFDDSVQRLSSLQDSDADCRTLTKTTRQTLSLLENAAELNQLQLASPSLPLQSVSLGTCLDRAIDRHLEDLRARDIQLVRHDAPAPTFVCAEPRKLERVLHELLENAIQFSNDGGTVAISTAIAISAVRSSYHDLPEVSVSIADNGTGIDLQEQHKLFQPFARIARHDNDRCGYGLGLAIAERTVAAMGGRLEIRSEGRDRGTVARVTLPVASANGTIPADGWDETQPKPAASPDETPRD